MRTIDVIVTILLVIGGLNWGFVGLFGFNFVAYIFGHLPLLERGIYILVGLGALYRVLQYLKLVKCSGCGS